MPDIIAKRGGFYHQIKGEELPDNPQKLDEIAKESGLSVKTLRYWKEGKSLPNLERLEKVARALKKEKKD